MPYPISVDTGQVAPWIISNDPASLAGSATVTLVANQVYLYAFEITANITITSAKWHIGTIATGTTDLGVYDVNGNLLAHTGPVGNVAATNMHAAFTSGNFLLGPGQYFLALCPSSASDNYLGITAVGAQAPLSRNRLATNTGVTGQLPTTMGSYTDNPSKIPALALTLLNGLM